MRSKISSSVYNVYSTTDTFQHDRKQLTCRRTNIASLRKHRIGMCIVLEAVQYLVSTLEGLPYLPKSLSFYLHCRDFLWRSDYHSNSVLLIKPFWHFEVYSSDPGPCFMKRYSSAQQLVDLYSVCTKG